MLFETADTRTLTAEDESYRSTGSLLFALQFESEFQQSELDSIDAEWDLRRIKQSTRQCLTFSQHIFEMHLSSLDGNSDHAALLSCTVDAAIHGA